MTKGFKMLQYMYQVKRNCLVTHNTAKRPRPLMRGSVSKKCFFSCVNVSEISPDHLIRGFLLLGRFLLAVLLTECGSILHGKNHERNKRIVKTGKALQNTQSRTPTWDKRVSPKLTCNGLVSQLVLWQANRYSINLSGFRLNSHIFSGLFRNPSSIGQWVW